MFHSSLSPEKIIFKSKVKVIFGKEWKGLMGVFFPPNSVTWELYHMLGLREAPAVDQYWARMWSLWYIFGCFACLQPACNTSLESCLHMACNQVFYSTRVWGRLVTVIDMFNPCSGAVCWAWSLSWKGQTKLCILKYNYFFFFFFYLLSMSGIVRKSAWMPVISFSPLRLDWPAFHWTYTATLVLKAMVYLGVFLLVNLDVCSFVCLFNMNLLLD